MAGVLAFAWSWLAGSDAEDLAGPSLSSWEAPFSAEKEARRPSSKQEILGPKSQVGRLAEKSPEMTERVLTSPVFRLRGCLRFRERKLELGGHQISLQGHKPAVTKADGSFEFKSVRAGRMVLGVGRMIVLDLGELRKRYLSLDTPEGSEESQRTGAPAVSGALHHWCASFMSVVVSRANPDQFLEIDVRSLDRVSGQVLFAGVERRPAVGARVRLMQVDEWFQMVIFTALHLGIANTTTDLNGSFEIGAWESGYWFVDVFVDGLPMTRQEVVIGGEKAPKPLEFHLAKLDVVVEAQLEGGADLDGIPVSLVMASVGLGRASMEMLVDSMPENTRTGKLVKGRCVFRGLAPGDYWIKIGEEHAPYFVVGGHQRRVTLKSELKTQRIRFKLKRAFQHVAKLQCEGKNISPDAYVVLAYRDGSGRILLARTGSWGIVTVSLDRRVDLGVQSVRGSLPQENGAPRSGHFEADSDASLKVFSSEEIKARGPKWGFRETGLVIPLRLKTK